MRQYFLLSYRYKNGKAVFRVFDRNNLKSFELFEDGVLKMSESIGICGVSGSGMEGLQKLKGSLSRMDVSVPELIIVAQSSDGLAVSDVYGNIFFVSDDFLTYGMYTGKKYLTNCNYCITDLNSSMIKDACTGSKALDSNSAKLAMLGISYYSIDKFGHMMFNGSKTQEIRIPSRVSELLPYQLYCAETNKITVEPGCKNIWTNAMANTKAEEIEIAGTVEDIWDFAANCNMRAKKIILHEGIKRIHRYAFNGTPNVWKVVLPDSLEYYTDNSFERNTEIINGEGKCMHEG